MAFVNRLTGEIDGQSKAAFDRAFNRLAHDIGDWTKIFEAAGELHLEWVYEQFFTEGAAGGTPWPDLSEAYEARKLAESPFSLMKLQRSGRMHLAFIRRGYSGEDGENVFQIGPRSAAFGATDWKAEWHQRGTGKMPARPIIVMNNDRRTALMKAVQAELLTIIRRTGLGTYGAESRAERGPGGGIRGM